MVTRFGWLAMKELKLVKRYWPFRLGRKSNTGPTKPVEPETIPAWSRQPRAETSGNKGVVTLRCKTGIPVA
jgi:hypothetical protein